MKTEYTVIDEFSIKNSKVIVLDEKRKASTSESYYILVDNHKFPCELTHNENWLIVNTDVSLKGKKIEIVS